MPPHARWASERPAPETYRAPANRSRADAIAEQDRAAGGRQQRKIKLANGVEATASIELKSLGGRRVYAYLRYFVDGRTQCDYIGEALGRTRFQRLQNAWKKVDAVTTEREGSSAHTRLPT
jgi:DNA mismatch endonuclease (patch repair protein)